VLAEDGSELAAELWTTPLPVATSLLSYPEGRAALAAASRAGRLTPRSYATACQDFDSAWREVAVVGMDGPLAERAGHLADEAGLRGYDAVHLASALALGPDTTVVTWDNDLAQAAAHAGCGVAPDPGT
jgi:predicted nucleic acid-binding protein